ncbi:MAG: hypothetical protein EZS28_022945 [Streblomastix strix]|uniref:Uncharacterized protein n=1 Tax=Streblomastix strix TaxID=222440 RepID=A0A5J4VG23_9EUKA|nr:MAG: hypothetical protein EZS28_022945 [Streblomastix strix]
MLQLYLNRWAYYDIAQLRIQLNQQECAVPFVDKLRELIGVNLQQAAALLIDYRACRLSHEAKQIRALSYIKSITLLRNFIQYLQVLDLRIFRSFKSHLQTLRRHNTHCSPETITKDAVSSIFQSIAPINVHNSFEEAELEMRYLKALQTHQRQSMHYSSTLELDLLTKMRNILKELISHAEIPLLQTLTIHSIQHVLEENTKETFVDLVCVCAALLRFAQRSTYIRIRIQEGAQKAQQFDPSYNGIISLAIQRQHTLRLIQGQGSQDLVNQQVDQYSALAMGPGQQILQLVIFTPTQIVQQFYSGQLIPKQQMQQSFQGFGMYPGIQQFQDFNIKAFSDRPNLLQAIAYNYTDSRASLKAYLSSCRIFQPFDCNKLNILIYSPHQHQAQQAINPFQLAYKARTLSN